LTVSTGQYPTTRSICSDYIVERSCEELHTAVRTLANESEARLFRREEMERRLSEHSSWDETLFHFSQKLFATFGGMNRVQLSVRWGSKA